MIYRSYWKRGGLLALVFSLCSCTYLIPDDPSVPRYNTVLGEKHRPSRNSENSGVGPQSSASDVVPAPITPVAVNELPGLPPVDAATQNQAQKELANSAPVASAVASGGRMVPVENIQLAGDVPAISSVPPRPAMTGNDATKTRLDATRRELEQERTSSEFTKDQLNRDAAAEPSMVHAPVDNATTPVISPPAPVMQAPLAPPPGPTSSIAPVPPMTLMPPPPPPPLPVAQSGFTAPVPMYATAAPQVASGLAPITLVPPSSMAPAKPAANLPSTMQLTSYAPPASSASGGFDPMAAAPAASSASPTSSYTSTGYLPPSRYTR